MKLLKSLCEKSLLPLQRKVRLRHVLHLGTIMEQQAEAFYRQFAEETHNDDIKKLCLKLADEEKEHLILIENKLSRWKSLPINQRDLKILDADNRLRKLFLSPPNQNAAEKAFIEYAIDQEQKMVTFYADFEEEFTNTWKLNRLKEMIDEEKGHVEEWSKMLSKL